MSHPNDQYVHGRPDAEEWLRWDRLTLGSADLHAVRPGGRVQVSFRARPWSGHGGRGYAAGVTDEPAPLPMRAVEQVHGYGLACAGYEVFVAALDQ